VEASINGVRLEMGLDTGAGISVITRSVARKVNARPLGGIAPQVGDSLGRSVNADLYVVDLLMGGMEARDLPVLVVEDARLRASVLGVTLFSFDGLVGWNVLGESRLVVDFETKKLSVGPSLRNCPARDLFSLGFKPLVEIRLNERPMLALVDLGARTSFALPGGLELAAGSRETRIVAGASGSTVQSVSVLHDVDVEMPGRKASLAKLSVRERDTKDALNSVTLGLDAIGAGTLVLDFPCGEFRSSG
jgi:predicted aspartyl protease